MAKRKRRSDVIWLAVEPDEYELPVYVADTLDDLARKYNVAPSTIRVLVARGSDATKKNRKFVNVKKE